MDLKAYFRDHRGHGVLSTSNDKGEVGIAMFAKPHVMDDGTVAFIMQHKQTHANLQTNPHAAYLFIEAVPETTMVLLDEAYGETGPASP